MGPPEVGSPSAAGLTAGLRRLPRAQVAGSWRVRKLLQLGGDKTRPQQGQHGGEKRDRGAEDKAESHAILSG